ncbi:MAG: type I restriction endonuclease subunit R, partial [Synergistaceae bacterium]|nr:type I restriction endonuclease subunit R [Synergistaceae bacterium]
MSTYNIVAETSESTVVAEYIPDRVRSKDYQSEADLERDFILCLCAQGYERLEIQTEAELVANLRRHLELLNNISFSDDEWKRFFAQNIAATNESVAEKTRKIQDDNVQILKRDDGSTKNIKLIDKKNIHNNRLQVLNQYSETEGHRETRYDVTVLVNGLP